MSNQTPHDKALGKAKIGLMSKPSCVFFTTLCFGLKFKWDEGIETAATNGVDMLLNPKFFMNLDPEERIFVLVHESMHVALQHTLRGEHYDHEKYNKAADHVINLMLEEHRFKMPNWVLKDPQYKDMSTEEVYRLLPDSPKSPNGGGGDQRPMCGDIIPRKDVAPQQAQQQVQDIILRAAMMSKQAGDKAGTIPGEIEIFLDNLLNPKLNWQQILRRFLQSYSKTDYSFKRPNRRFFPDHYLPSMHGESLIDLSIAVDTSGSVSDHDFKVFVSEVASIFKMMKPKKITLVQFDTVIHSIDELSCFEDLMKIKFSGRGGTMIDEVVEWANKKKPQLLLMFTDGEIWGMPSTPIKSQTLWMIHNNKGFAAPYGKVIHYEI